MGVAWQGIHVTAYSPLGSPDSATMMKRSEDAPRLLQEPVVLDISKKHNKPAGQVRDACCQSLLAHGRCACLFFCLAMSCCVLCLLSSPGDACMPQHRCWCAGRCSTARASSPRPAARSTCAATWTRCSGSCRRPSSRRCPASLTRCALPSGSGAGQCLWKSAGTLTRCTLLVSGSGLMLMKSAKTVTWGSALWLCA